MTIAAIALVGWWWHAPLLQSGVPGFVAMNPVTAIGFLLAGSALLLIHARHRHHRNIHGARLLALAVLLVPLLCLSRLFLPWDLGPDRILFSRELIIPEHGFPNRMAPVTALNFVLFGIALLLFTSRSKLFRRCAVGVASLAGFIALVVLVDYAYRSSLASVRGLIPVALNTAVAFLLFAVAMLSARPTDGIAALVFRNSPGGMLARRLLPASFVIPLLVGWAELRGQHVGWYDDAGGAAAVAISTTLVLAALIWLNSNWVDGADHRRSLAERNLRDFNAQLETRVRERTHELHETQERYRKAADELRGWFNASPLANCGLTPDNRVVSWNPAAEALFGWEASEIIGHELPIIPPELEQESLDLTAQVVAGRPFTNLETQRQRRDGRMMDVSISTASLHDAAGVASGLVVIYADIGERKRFEAQLRQAQKMEAVGRLAGGVAHDFNNILTVIQAAAAFLLEDLGAGDPRRGEAIDIVDAARRAAAMTRQLLAFSRQQVLELQVLDVNYVINLLEPMLRRLLEANIELVFRLDADAGHIKADTTQLDQILLNLVVNARDSISGGGSIIIETQRVMLDADFAETHFAVRPGPHVMISVTDTGAGMSAETQAHIFEPFYTTKSAGHGTGFGLSTVYGIVQQFGGHVWVYSEIGCGSVFKIYLPLAPEPAIPAPTRAPAVRGPVRITILLVEDDAPVRKSVRRMLERMHYDVLEASNAAEALVILADTPGLLQLVLSDMVMPGMSGVDLKDRIAHDHPALPVLLMSGYSEQAILHLRDTGELGLIIQKPFTIDELAAKIELALLEGAQPGVVV